MDWRVVGQYVLLVVAVVGVIIAVIMNRMPLREFFRSGESRLQRVQRECIEMGGVWHVHYDSGGNLSGHECAQYPFPHPMIKPEAE